MYLIKFIKIKNITMYLQRVECNACNWGGKFWDTPEGFNFPSTKQFNGFQLWLKSLPSHTKEVDRVQVPHQ